ncbi:unnamed protein product [Plutella xylostella]|uniref:(diamondback moth) hypothetical protein n=1 Tax=Plutella xylostella TaxID=51655 RepID=A0A8S4EQX2_PLUXY|nr:unnamed protein product [Plutella xylostella]
MSKPLVPKPKDRCDDEQSEEERVRRLWRLLLLEIFLALLLIGLSIIVSRPIFLTPVRETAEPALKTEDIIQALDKDTYLGYAPAEEPYESIMKKAAEYLQIPVRGAKSITELEDSLYLNYSRSKGVVRFPVVWIIFDSETGNNFWKFKIRSRASPGAFVETYKEVTDELQQQLGSGLLAAQVAVSQAVLQRAAPGANYEVHLQPMPESPLTQEVAVKRVLVWMLLCLALALLPPVLDTVALVAIYRLMLRNLKATPESPLTQEVAVKRALVWMLLCLALALLPPVLDTVALVASETNYGFKRALCLRDVDFSVIYLGWLSYAFFTTLPVCMITAIYLIFTFRWIKLWSTFLFVMSYQLVMLMMAFILTMFHDTAAMACIWVASMVVAQMFICLQFAHYNFGFLSMFLQVFMPPMGLSNAMHSFALLQIGRGESTTLDSTPIYVTNWCWVLVSILYFGVLMMMQRTLGRQRAIRGQVPWKSLFQWKKAAPQLHHVYVPTGKEREPLQEVDELVAKAISFNNVSKESMGAVHLQDVTLDIYRGEYSMLYAERIQKSTPRTLEDLITGLTLPDEGTINILGRRLDGSSVVAPHMLGYCPHAISLLPDLTVQEHLYLFIAISMWNESSYFMEEYAHIRQQRLLAECGLEAVALVKISQLSTYYQAQVCWALAMLLEPRVVFIPNFTDKPVYVKVIIDKILQYQKHLTIVQTCISSIRLEYADRVFIFDHHRLIFGGTPAYMYFKYGRQYRVRLNLTGHRSEQHDENMSDLVKRIRAAGGSISIKFRTLLICRLPVSPTDSIEDLLRHLKENARQYGIKAVHLHLPDSEEICRRAISESTKTLLSSILLGVLMGQSLTVHPAELAARAGVATEQDQLLTVEAARQRTTVVLRASSTPAALDVANAYIMSDERSGDNGHVTYTSLNSTDSLTEYLMIQAIHSPQQYVYKYAYGMEVEEVEAKYSPFHVDRHGAARSLARVYMALLRHYTDTLDANIHVVNKPLSMDKKPWLLDEAIPPFLIQVLMLLTVSHVLLLPSLENGLIRHTQRHAINFSPFQYWAALYLWDLILFMIMIVMISGIIFVIMHIVVPWYKFGPSDYSKCGVLQACFEKKSYFTFKGGVLEDIIALIVAGTVYFTILMLWEYWIIKKIINKVLTDWIFPGRIVIHEQMPGLIEEKRKVMEKVYQLKDRDVPTTNPFGEYLLVNGVSLKQHGLFSLTNIYLGVGRGGALAVSGIGRHGRVALCELLAGYRLPTGGDALVMSKYSLWRSPHKYSQHVSLCCGRTPLPPWLAVRHALELIAVLRGIPRKAVKGIVRNYIDALDLSDQAHVQVRFLSHYDRQKFHFLTAVIAAPPVIVLDEYVSQHQSVAVREAIYSILYHLSKRGHAVIVAASTVRLNLPVSDRLAIILNGNIYDIDHIDRLIHMYGTEGFIVVVHLKNDVDVATMFAEYFDSFHINDATEVLVNVQVYDAGLDWAEVFSRMERLQSHHHDVYSYIITSIPIDFIYNSIILKETWNSLTLTPYPCIFKRIFSRGGHKRQPTPELVENLKTFDPKYSVKYLNELPWSVVFHK